MSAREHRSRRALDLVVVLAFVAAIAAPALDMAIRPASERDASHENRTPARRPSMPGSLAQTARWPQAFKAWFADTFGLRDRLLGARNTGLIALELSPTSTIDVGPTGWLFYRGDAEFEAQRGTYRPEPGAIDAWVDALEKRRIRLADRGAHFLFALAPDKEVLYPEHRPSTWEPVGPSFGDQLLEALAKRSKVEVVDLRPALREAKEHDRPEAEDYAYFPRGTHWTSRGACYATNAILDALRPRFQGLEPVDCGSLRIVAGDPSGEDSWVHNLYTPWLLRSFPFASLPDGGTARMDSVPTGPLETGISIGRDEDAPSILFLHDSYGPFLLPFLAERASRVRSQWQSWVPELVVDVERPDVVLMIKAERMLSQPPDPDLETSIETTHAAGPIWTAAEIPTRTTVVGEGRLERDGDSVLWTPATWTDHLVIESSRSVEPRASLLVTYEIDAPAGGGNFEVWPSERDVAGWMGKRRLRVPLEAGRNTGELVLQVRAFGDRALVRLGPGGEFRIRKLELRASPRGN